MSLSSIVIKVKYGETLRRISPSVHDKKLSLDFFMLKERIRSLLGFAPGAMFNMTYEDEDGDIVTLANDDDIRDVMQQSLDPLRITVKLTYGNHPGGSNGASAPMKFPHNSFQQPPPKPFHQPPQNSFHQPPQNSFQQPPQNPFQQPPQNPYQQQQQQLQLQQQLLQCQQRQQQLQAQLLALNSMVSSSPVPLEPLPQPQFQTMNAPFNRMNGGKANSSASTDSF